MVPLIFKSLWYYKKQHVSVLAGTMLSTAILTGALIIGDSVRYSLHTMVEKRLGKTVYTINTGNRFIRAKLAEELSEHLHIPTAPVLMMKGVANRSDNINNRYSVQIIGIDDHFNRFSIDPIQPLQKDEAVVSEKVARDLKLSPGSELILRVENIQEIPLNTPLVNFNKPPLIMRLTVKSIVNDQCLGSFNLKNNQTAPYNIFVSRAFIASLFGLSDRVNLVLIGGDQPSSAIQQVLDQNIQLADIGLKIRELPERQVYELESDRIFIDKQAARMIDHLPVNHQDIITYLVNSIHGNGKETPYSFVTAISDSQNLINKDAITINEWLANDLNLTRGDTVTMNYYIMGPYHTLTEKKQRFIVNQIIETGSGLDDKTFMPSIPGFSDAVNCREWNPGVPIDLKKIRKKDEKYWDQHRGTPKGIISLETGVKLWDNPFGNYTAIRFDKKEFPVVDSLNTLILHHLSPENFGLTILPVRTEGLTAAANATDFGELFLYLSFFIMVAAVMLIALVYSLNIQTRMQESAILSGVGYRKLRIVFIRLAESLLVVIPGGIIGALLGIGYTHLLMTGLNSIWIDIVQERMLQVHIVPTTLISGSLIGMSVAIITISLVTVRTLRHPVAFLVKGPFQISSFRVNQRPYLIIAILGFTGAIILVSISIITASWNSPGMFLSAGGLLLLGSTSFISIYISHISEKDPKTLNFFRLAVRNSGRNKYRSLATILILAIGTFILILTGSYRKTFYGEENLIKSGTGGYILWVETTLPVTYNLNSAEGQRFLNTIQDSDLNRVHFLQLHSLEGDDASCLNLNQVKNPDILGIDPYEFDRRGAFSVVTLLDNHFKKHPWLTLVNSGDKSVIPALADQTVIQYGLNLTIGDTIPYRDESGDTILLRLVASLDNSIFQGHILIADSAFIKHFPSVGSKIMLIDAPKIKQSMVSDVMNSSFSDLGVSVSPTTARLAAFNAVENTYLSVFMALGGLGLLMGTLGLGIILYRNMLERRYELALLRALGYKKDQVFQLVILENIFLLVIGLLCGLVSAFIAILPSLVSPSFQIQGRFLTFLIMSVLLVGMGWIFILSKSVVSGNLVTCLRDE